MDGKASEFAIKECLVSISDRLTSASALAKAAALCAQEGKPAEGVRIALDIEQPLYEATTLLNAASLMRRLGYSTPQ